MPPDRSRQISASSCSFSPSGTAMRHPPCCVSYRASGGGKSNEGPFCNRLGDGMQGGDMLGGVAARMLLVQADPRLDAGSQLHDLVVAQVVGTDDGDGVAAGFVDVLAGESGSGGHGSWLLPVALALRNPINESK